MSVRNKRLAPTEPKFPTLFEASLGQALRWVADGLPPLAKHHEEIEDYPRLLEERQIIDHYYLVIADKYVDAGRKIAKALALGHLIAIGSPSWPRALGYAWFDDDGELFLDAFITEFLRQEILKDSVRWGRIDWLKSAIRLYEDENDYETACIPFGPDDVDPQLLREDPRLGPIALYRDVKISADSLYSVFPHEGLRASFESAPDNTTPEFRSPFVELILRAEKHFGDRLLSAKKTEIVDWLNQEGAKTLGSHWSANKSESMATFLRKPDLQKGGNKKIGHRG